MFAIIRVLHSDLIDVREYFDVPVPNEKGPLSVEPPSILITSGDNFNPFSKAFISKPKPSTPDGTKTFVFIVK